jgi:hypothetical protein
MKKFNVDLAGTITAKSSSRNIRVTKEEDGPITERIETDKKLDEVVRLSRESGSLEKSNYSGSSFFRSSDQS